jgi:hypothetical protein
MNTLVNMAASLATVGKTEEQLAAEKAALALAEKQARWAKAVAARPKGNAEGKFFCEAQVSNGSYSIRHHDCGIKANYHREEHLDSYDQNSPMIVRHYCKRHDPVSSQEKLQAKWAEEKREREAKWAAQDRAAHRSSLIGKAVGHLSNDQLVALDEFLQSSLLTAEFRKVTR